MYIKEKALTIKLHILDNKKWYVVGGISFIFGVAGSLILVGRVNHGPNIIQKINQIAWHPENNQMIVNFVERSTPSKPVHLVDTNLYFDSIHEASRQTGHSVAMISRNINGHIADIKGDIFKALEKVS